MQAATSVNRIVAALLSCATANSFHTAQEEACGNWREAKEPDDCPCC